jgi:hypothetical protein
MSGFTDVWASIGHRLASPDNGRLARHAVTWEDRVVPGAFEVQNPEFVIDRDGRTLMILVDDGKRLATLLELRPADADANSAALKIRKAMQTGGTTEVELSIGEDEAVISALEELQRSGNFSERLSNLLLALKKKIAGESV